MDGLNSSSKIIGVTAIVEYDYTAKEPDELDLVKGAMIHSIKQMPGGWWEGTLPLNGKTGMFPDNFVRVVDMSEETSVTLRDKSATSNRRCKVIYSYTQVNDDELSLAVGDVIEFLGEVEEGWWRGRLKNKVGVFPSNFVISIEQSPKLASKRPPSTFKTTTSSTTTTTNAANTTTTILPISNNNNHNHIINNNNNNNNLTNSNSMKKGNRLSFHNSKEDLLSNSSGVSSTTSNHTVSSSSAVMSSTASDGELLAPSLPPKPLREYCRVEYPYAPQNDDELELKVGDIITIISTELPDKGWWKGELRGKVGVFPDNFVKIVPPVTPANDAQDQLQQQQQQLPAQQQHHQVFQQQHTQRTSYNKLNSSTATTATTSPPPPSTISTGPSSNHSNSSLVSSTTSNAAAAVANASSTTSKVFIKKSGSNSSSSATTATTTTTTRQAGGEQHKDSFGSRDSLNDILSETGLPSGNVAAQRKSLENKNLDLSKKQIAATDAAAKNHHNSLSSGGTSDLRKSLENMDEKTKTTTTTTTNTTTATTTGTASFPPVLSKKPAVASKKSTSVTSVAGNILSGLKQRVKGVENKLTTATSSDAADGIGSSRMSSSPSSLPEAAPGGQLIMRRAATLGADDTEFDNVERASMLPDMRAGRVRAPKRRPPSAAINNNNNSSTNDAVHLNGSNGSGGVGDISELETNKSSDDNSTGEEQLAKPKPREWEKKKAPWMEELKASQVRKKVSPIIDRTSKLMEIAEATSIAKVQSSNISSSSVMQQSMIVESKKDEAIAMSRSMSSKLVNSEHSSSSASTLDDVRARPNSLSLRNSSNISPATLKSSTDGGVLQKSATTSAVIVTHNNNSSHHVEEEISNDDEAAGGRLVELEARVDKLENIVQTQQRTIDELVRALREETERVKGLRGELDKYAQCVTQV